MEDETTGMTRSLSRKSIASEGLAWEAALWCEELESEQTRKSYNWRKWGGHGVRQAQEAVARRLGSRLGLVFHHERHCGIKCGSGVRPCLPREAGIEAWGNQGGRLLLQFVGETEAGLGLTLMWGAGKGIRIRNYSFSPSPFLECPLELSP